MFTTARGIHLLSLARLVVAVVSAHLLLSESAQAQGVPRLIVARDHGPGFPDFGSAGAHALVVSPADATAALPFAVQDPLTIAAMIAENLGEDAIDPDDLLEMSTFVAAELSGSWELQECLFVADKGVMRPQILWKSGYPKPATAKAGRQGEILMLGVFIAEQIDTTSDPFPGDDVQHGYWRVTTSPTAAVWDEFSIAIGWFSR